MLFDTGISSSSEEEEEFEEEEYEDYVSEESEDYLSEESSYETTTATTTLSTSKTTTEYPENESEEASDGYFMQMDAITEEMEFPVSSEVEFFEEPEELEEPEDDNDHEFSIRSSSTVTEQAVNLPQEEEVEVEYHESESDEKPLILNDFIITPESEEEEEEILEFIEAKENADAKRLTMGLVPRNLASFGCTHCFAHNMTECLNTGTYSHCQENEVCQIEIRKREGDVRWVGMRCKHIEACYDNKAQNFIGKFADRQCRPSSMKSPSVCRQCCATDRCTDNFNPLTHSGWKIELIS